MALGEVNDFLPEFVRLSCAAAVEEALWQPLIERLVDFVGREHYLAEPADVAAGIRHLLASEMNPDCIRLVVRCQPSADAVPVAGRGALLQPFWHPLSGPGSAAPAADEILHIAISIPRGTVTLGAFAPAADPAVRSRMHALRHLILPYVEHAMRTALSLARAEHQLRRMHSALDVLPFGVLICDGAGRLECMSQSAERLLAKQGDLSIRDGVLFSLHAPLRLRMQRALLEATTPVAATTLLELKRPEGGDPCMLLLAPLQAGGMGFDADAQARAIVLISEDWHSDAHLQQNLQQLYHLSLREVELALALMRGRRVEDHAGDRQISVATARSQLQAVFVKTGTSRQGDLIRLLHAIPRLSQFKDTPQPGGV
ncbi:MAG TPA: hypothetical protein VLI06_15270 [Solimonas sp.]|nr:hypothetical protein [Solimonas sp.]